MFRGKSSTSQCFEKFYRSCCIGVVDANSVCGFGEDFDIVLMVRVCISGVGENLGFGNRDCFLFTGFEGEWEC